MLKQSSSLLFKITHNSGEIYPINEFIELFLPNGPLEEMKEDIFGVVIHNYARSIFNVTFNTAVESKLPNIVDKYDRPTPLTSQTGKALLLEVRYVNPPTETVTLHPVPHGITAQEIQAITRSWGEMVAFDYGRHKLIPSFRNSFLHIKLKNLVKHALPERITINKHFVAVIPPGEDFHNRCGFCKLAGHLARNCPSKTLPRPAKPSYAQAATAFETTPYTVPTETSDKAGLLAAEPPIVAENSGSCSSEAGKARGHFVFADVEDVIDQLDSEEQRLLTHSIQLLEHSKTQDHDRRVQLPASKQYPVASPKPDDSIEQDKILEICPPLSSNVASSLLPTARPTSPLPREGADCHEQSTHKGCVSPEKSPSKKQINVKSAVYAHTSNPSPIKDPSTSPEAKASQADPLNPPLTASQHDCLNLFSNCPAAPRKPHSDESKKRQLHERDTVSTSGCTPPNKVKTSTKHRNRKSKNSS